MARRATDRYERAVRSERIDVALGGRYVELPAPRPPHQSGLYPERARMINALRGMSFPIGSPCVLTLTSGLLRGVHSARLVRRTRSGRLELALIDRPTYFPRPMFVITDVANVNFSEGVRLG